jgi:hypothetical protein
MGDWIPAIRARLSSSKFAPTSSGLPPDNTLLIAGWANSPRGALLHRAGASEVVVKNDLIAGALVDRLGKAPRV